MKKFFALLISMLMLCPACFAEVDFNVEDYTDDELIDIVHIIYESNSSLGYLYPNEEIVIGVDMPAGLYEFWIEESDIALSQKMIEEDLDYHCGFTTLCVIAWGDDNGGEEYENVEYCTFYYDEYGDHRMVRLEEGQVIATYAVYGVNYRGARMKYIGDGKSGLFDEK